MCEQNIGALPLIVETAVTSSVGTPQRLLLKLYEGLHLFQTGGGESIICLCGWLFAPLLNEEGKGLWGGVSKKPRAASCLCVIAVRENPKTQDIHF